MMQSMDVDGIKGYFLGQAVETENDDVFEGTFSTRKVVSRDENQRFNLIDKVAPENATNALNKFGKIKTIERIKIFFKALVTTRSFKQARVAVHQSRLMELNKAIKTHSTSLGDREVEAYQAYNYIKSTSVTGYDPLEQESAYLKGMVDLLNEPDNHRNPDLRASVNTDEEGPTESAMRECEGYLISRKQLDEMEAARELLESSIGKE